MLGCAGRGAVIKGQQPWIDKWWITDNSTLQFTQPPFFSGQSTSDDVTRMGREDQLRVIIVGSGLAGLTAARILREHHDVTVYERGDANVATGGQGIMIAPNGVKILESVGYEPHRAGAVPISGMRTYDKTCNFQEDVGIDFKTRFGADCLAQKRSDFRDELMQLATAPSADLGIKGDPAKVVFNSAITDLDTEKGIVTLSNGSTAAADAVIGKSEPRKHIPSNRVSQ